MVSDHLSSLLSGCTCVAFIDLTAVAIIVKMTIGHLSLMVILNVPCKMIMVVEAGSIIVIAVVIKNSG